MVSNQNNKFDGLKKNFGRFWISGLIFGIIYGIITTIVGWIQENLLINLSQTYPMWFWGLIIGLIGIISFIFIPWILGRLIKWIYEEFKLNT
ncbi:MAG: hypothetical protein ACP5C3_01935 [Methanomicrobiales archaeon]